MKKIIVLIFIISIILIGCDRYKHDFTTEPDNQTTPQQFFTQYKNILTRIDTTNIDTILSYYDENYLNNGETKDDIRTFYQSLLNYNFTEISIENVQITDLNISYNLILMNQTDTLFAKDITDVLKRSDDSYLFIGNQQGGAEQTTQRVLVLLFTGTHCPNCPYSEEALEELKTQEGQKFSYVEFHRYIADPLEIPASLELYNYYGLPGVPNAIFQGQTIYGHFHDQTTQTYQEAIDHYAELEATMFLEDLQYSIDGTTLNGSVNLRFLQNDYDHLKLMATVVEKVSDVTNYNGDLCKQVALAYSAIDIEPTDNTYNFTVNDLPETLPDDMQIIVWVQRVLDAFNQEECKVLNVIEEDINR